MAEDGADVGFAALYSWHSTFLWTDYTTAYLTAGVTCLVPKPNKLPTWMSLWLPFSPVMWTAIGVSILVITFALYTLARASRRYLGMHLDSSSGNCTLYNGSVVNRVSPMKICVLEDGRMTETCSAVK
jgi:hypothetical protein